MEDGFYWIKIEDKEPEVVEFLGDKTEDRIFRCGDEYYYRKNEGVWIGPWDEPFNVVFLSGKLTPPNA